MEGIKKYAKLIFGGIGMVITVLLLARVITAIVAATLIAILFIGPMILIPQAMGYVFGGLVDKITSTKVGDLIFRAIVLTFLGAIVLFWISDCLGYVKFN